jgi:rubrerythrin
MYPEFAKIAEEENLPEIAKRLRAISIAEKHHEERYKNLIDKIKKGEVFKREKVVVWVCRECGYVHKERSLLKNALRVTSKSILSN